MSKKELNLDLANLAASRVPSPILCRFIARALELTRAANPFSRGREPQVTKRRMRQMIKAASPLLLSGFFCLLAGTANAEQYYNVKLTNENDDFYSIDGKFLTIETSFCSVNAHSEEAILKIEGYSGEVLFMQSKDKCDVKGIFGTAKPSPGKYPVTVFMEKIDWYEVMGTTLYIKTLGCLSLAPAEEGYLFISPSGIGQLRFKASELDPLLPKKGLNCIVEKIYTKLAL